MHYLRPVICADCFLIASFPKEKSLSEKAYIWVSWGLSRPGTFHRNVCTFEGFAVCKRDHPSPSTSNNMGFINLMAYRDAWDYFTIRMFRCRSDGLEYPGYLRVIVCTIFVEAQESWIDLRRLCRLVNGEEMNFSIPRDLPIPVSEVCPRASGQL